ncbi:MAG: hypothetical protein WAU77_04420 [Solirubrobacteraceae bacterium]
MSDLPHQTTGLEAYRTADREVPQTPTQDLKHTELANEARQLMKNPAYMLEVREIAAEMAKLRFGLESTHSANCR